MKPRIKYKAICMIFITILSSLTMFASLTAAWFVTIRNAGTKADGFITGDTVLIEKVAFHEFVSKKEEPGKEPVISFDEAESPEAIDDVRLGSDLGYYNLLSDDYQLLMEVTLTSEAVSGGIEIDLYAATFAEKSHLTADLTGKPERPLTNEKDKLNSLSSIVDFYVFFEKDVEISDGKINLKRNDNENSKENGKAIRNFIASNDGIVSGGSILLSNFKPSEIQNDEGVAKFFVMFDYNEENCAKMYGNNLGNDAIDLGHILSGSGASTKYLEKDGLPVLKFAADFEFRLMMR